MSGTELGLRTVRTWCGRCSTKDVAPARALPTPVPGLSVAEIPEPPCGCGRSGSGSRFSVTHDRSGLSVAFCEDPEQAFAVAVALQGIDWTLSASDLEASPAAVEAVREALPAFNATTRGVSGDTADLTVPQGAESA